jgi:hypothetical protein
MLIGRRTLDRNGARGQTLAVFAIFLVVLLGSTALAVDYGSWLNARRTYQNVVDAAVLQGSVLLERPVDATKQRIARRATWQSINDQLALGLSGPTLDGFAASDTPVGTPQTPGGYRIWVSTPPLGGPGAYGGNYSGSNRVMFAWIDRENSAFFSRILGFGDQQISAWATSGSFPNRFAVITLRKNGQPTMGNPTDIDINGGTVLNVFDGDVGGNWGLSVNGVNSALVMHSSTGDAYGVYLAENVPTGGNGWTPGQVRTDTGTPVPVQFHAEVADPNYPSPCDGDIKYDSDPTATACLEDRTAVFTNSHRTTTNRTGDSCAIDPAETVGPANDRLPTGRYHDIRVDSGECLVFDPTFDQKDGRRNGIVYITGTLDVNQGGLVIGDGVTLVFARGADLNVNGPNGIISLNKGNTTNNAFADACGGNPGGTFPNDCRFAGWTAKAGGGGAYSWGLGTSTAYTSPPLDPFERGLAAIVCKSSTDCDSGGGPSTNIFQINAGAGIDYRGLIYAPYDNAKVAGQPNHNDIGQLVAWTAQFTGGSEINQTWDGPDSNTPVLLEPRLGQ